MATLSPADVIAQIERLLADTGLTGQELLTEAQYDDAIQWAVSEYSRDRPRLAVADVAGAGTEFILLSTITTPIAWEEGASQVKDVEYPAGPIVAGYSPSLLAPGEGWSYYDAAAGRYLQLLATPQVGETVRVRFTASHKVLAGSPAATNTVPAFDQRAVWSLAASRACTMLATKKAGDTEGKTGIDDMNYRDGQMRYKQQADAFFAIYAAHVRGEKNETPPVAGGRRRWDSIPILERGASRIIRGT